MFLLTVFNWSYFPPISYLLPECQPWYKMWFWRCPSVYLEHMWKISYVWLKSTQKALIKFDFFIFHLFKISVSFYRYYESVFLFLFFFLLNQCLKEQLQKTWKPNLHCQCLWRKAWFILGKPDIPVYKIAYHTSRRLDLMDLLVSSWIRKIWIWCPFVSREIFLFFDCFFLSRAASTA